MITKSTAAKAVVAEGEGAVVVSVVVVEAAEVVSSTGTAQRVKRTVPSMLITILRVNPQDQ